MTQEEYNIKLAFIKSLRVEEGVMSKGIKKMKAAKTPKDVLDTYEEILHTLYQSDLSLERKFFRMREICSRENECNPLIPPFDTQPLATTTSIKANLS